MDVQRDTIASMTVSSLSFSLPRQWRKPLNLGSAALLLLLTIGLGVKITSGYLERADTITELKTDIARTAEALEARGNARSPLPEDGAEVASNIFAADLESATAHMQSVVRDLGAAIGALDVQIEGTRVLPTIVGVYVNAVRISVALKVPATHVFDAINVLESTVPSVLLDDVRIGSAQLAEGNRIEKTSDASVLMSLMVEARMYMPNLGSTTVRKKQDLDRE